MQAQVQQFQIVRAQGFDAGFVVGLLEGLPLEQVGKLANACGALGATVKGPMEGAFPREVVEEFMRAREAN